MPVDAQHTTRTRVSKFITIKRVKASKSNSIGEPTVTLSLTTHTARAVTLILKIFNRQRCERSPPCANSFGPTAHLKWTLIVKCKAVKGRMKNRYCLAAEFGGCFILHLVPSWTALHLNQNTGY